MPSLWLSAPGGIRTHVIRLRRPVPESKLDYERRLWRHDPREESSWGPAGSRSLALRPAEPALALKTSPTSVRLALSPPRGGRLDEDRAARAPGAARRGRRALARRRRPRPSGVGGGGRGLRRRLRRGLRP